MTKFYHLQLAKCSRNGAASRLLGTRSRNHNTPPQEKKCKSSEKAPALDNAIETVEIFSFANSHTLQLLFYTLFSANAALQGQNRLLLRRCVSLSSPSTSIFYKSSSFLFFRAIELLKHFNDLSMEAILKFIVLFIHICRNPSLILVLVTTIATY